MKKCPFCAEPIQEDAIKCRFCGEFLNKKKLTDQVANLTKSATNVVISDIKKAEYPNNEIGAGKSITGWIFILCGGMLGASLCCLIVFCLLSEKTFNSTENISIYIVFIGGTFGGLFGQWLHQKIKNKF